MALQDGARGISLFNMQLKAPQTQYGNNLNITNVKHKIVLGPRG
jgi:hypothetical protein